MTSTKAPGVRARVRAQLTSEIKESARRQLATDGAASISLRAIARELDMASSAIYRYFPSRDDLLTALIIDAYNSVGAAVETADAAHDRSAYRDRLLAITSAIRTWAVANPHEYALIYGSPVPGYAAPDDTIDPATRVTIPLISVSIEHWLEHYGADGSGSKGSGSKGSGGQRDLADGLADAVAGLSSFVDDQLPATVLIEVIAAWGELFGIISLELFGHFNNVVDDPQAVFAHAMGRLADRILAV